MKDKNNPRKYSGVVETEVVPAKPAIYQHTAEKKLFMIKKSKATEVNDSSGDRPPMSKKWVEK